MANKTTSPPHTHPSEGVPVRIAKESGFAAPGLDVPAQQSRPARDAGTPQDHPVNRPLRDEDKSLIGPQLGRGGTTGPRLAPVEATCVYTDPGFSGEQGETFVPGVGPGPGIDEHFQDVSSLITKPRGS
jgi:hypothetical protein